MSVDVGGLILEVQEKPKLDTRVRERNTKTRLLGADNLVGDIRVLVVIEHHPNARVGTSPSPSLFILGRAELFNASVDKCPRICSDPLDTGRYAGPRLPIPVLGVVRFGLGSFGEYPNRASSGAYRQWAATAHELARSTAASNSASEMMGIAP